LRVTPAMQTVDIPHLSSIVRECGYMAKSRCWKERLLFRLAKDKLDQLTQQAIAEGVEKPTMKHNGQSETEVTGPRARGGEDDKQSATDE